MGDASQRESPLKVSERGGGLTSRNEVVHQSVSWPTSPLLSANNNNNNNNNIIIININIIINTVTTTTTALYGESEKCLVWDEIPTVCCWRKKANRGCSILRGFDKESRLCWCTSGYVVTKESLSRLAVLLLKLISIGVLGEIICVGKKILR